MKKELERAARAELKLPRIIRRRRRSRRSVKQIHIQRVVLINQIEDISRNLHLDLVRERKRTRDPQIREHRVRLHPKVAAEIARVETACRTSTPGSVNIARKIERPGRRILRKHRSRAATREPAVGRDRVGTIRQRIEVEVRIGARKNIERTPRRDLDDRRNRETRKDSRHTARTANKSRVLNPR